MKSFLTLCLLFSASFAYAQAVSTSAGATKAAKNKPGTTAAVSLSSSASTSTADEKAIANAERHRFNAQVNKDYAVLNQLLADDLVYTHSHGGTDTKQSYIQSIRDGKSQYDAIDILEQKIRVYGNTAVVNGICMIKATNNGESINTRLRYTDVYVRNGSQWQMVTWQSLRLAQ
ncbi:nuclear transport factor 2 family protein [Spirosoma taeanense]|uniref:Nuclear transport factor 2 family protein n=1 Tax=Spirosoma taeanense TaxID=2735870 RepID=A0A6M5Y8I3_9BACT|nr:nuclear transport factor 2 family protein [Spirosoma taeanense]QJW89561.1 nuclear transport factor 2 family protein [Spirosoma taeanense]